MDEEHSVFGNGVCARPGKIAGRATQVDEHGSGRSRWGLRTGTRGRQGAEQHENEPRVLHKVDFRDAVPATPGPLADFDARNAANRPPRLTLPLQSDKL